LIHRQPHKGGASALSPQYVNSATGLCFNTRTKFLHFSISPLKWNKRPSILKNIHCSFPLKASYSLHPFNVFIRRPWCCMKQCCNMQFMKAIYFSHGQNSIVKHAQAGCICKVHSAHTPNWCSTDHPAANTRKAFRKDRERRCKLCSLGKIG